jgi:hypothetical protein
MIMAILFSSLVGAVLGCRLKVRVLFLAAPLAFAMTAGVVAVTQGTIGSALLGGVAAVIALQIGYLGGLFTRFSVAAAQIPPKPSVSSTTTARG